MFVSKERQREVAGRAEALDWLQRQLAWEAVLRGLRQAAGVLPGDTTATPRAA